jgi:thymidylate synthase (FAD)
VLEHSLLIVKITTARSISHQLVRHRLCAFSQESQRYCNYSKDKFDNEITVIRPAEFADDSSFDDWLESCLTAEQSYFAMLSKGLKPEVARAVLPNCTKTELVMSANYREWRHILKERTSSRADPSMRKLMGSLLSELHSKIPVVFDDIKDNSSLHEEDKEAIIELKRLAETHLRDRQFSKTTFDISAEDLQFLSVNEENEDT